MGTFLPSLLNGAAMVHSALGLMVLAQAVSLRNPLLSGGEIHTGICKPYTGI